MSPFCFSILAKSIKGINVVIGASTTGLQKALSDVNKKSKDIQKELGQVNKALKFDPSNTELLRQKKELLSQAVSNTRDKLEQLKNVQEQVNDQFAKGEISDKAYREFNREIATTEERLRYLQQELKKTGFDFEQVGQSVKDAGESIQQAGKNISSAGSALTKGITLPLLAVGGLAVKAASDFESAMAGVDKTLDLTQEEFAYFEQEILNMSKVLPQSAVEIAGVAEAAGQLGITKDNLLGFTQAMLDLGVATDMSSEQAAMTLARFANITNMAQDDFDRLGATLVDLGNNFAATEGEIAQMGMNIAGAGSQIGMTEADILGFGAALASVGINAEAGGTAISKLMIEMASDVDMGGERLDEFARVARMSTDEFATLFKEDAATAIFAFLGGLGELSEEGESAFKIIDELGLSEIRLRDTILRTSNARDISNKALETANNAWGENTALTDEAAKRYETFEAQLKIFFNNVKIVAIEFGKALLPAMQSALEAAKPLINNLAVLAQRFAALDPGIQQTIIAVTAMVMALGPILQVIGQITFGIGALTKGFGSIILTLAKLKPLFVALGAVIGGISAPVWIAIGVISALVAGGVLLYKNLDKIKETAANLRKGLEESFERMRASVSDRITAMKDSVMEKWESIMAFFKGINLADIGRDIIQGLINGIKDKFNALKDQMKAIGESIKDTIANVLGIRSPSRVMIGFGENIGEGMAIGIERASSMVQEMSQRMANMAVPDVSRFAGHSVSNSTINNYQSFGDIRLDATDLRQIDDIIEFFTRLQQTARQM